MIDAVARELKFRDPVRAASLSSALARTVEDIGRAPVSVMHVCGSHEQAIARFGLRTHFPRDLHVIMGPGCPVCITDQPEVDEAVALARQGVRIATYGDMVRVPGTALSLADAQGEGARVEVVYSIDQAVALARGCSEPVVFFGTGFETTAVATAAAILAGLPPNFFVLSAHKYIPPVMEIVAQRIGQPCRAGRPPTAGGPGMKTPGAATGGCARHALGRCAAGLRRGAIEAPEACRAIGAQARHALPGEPMDTAHLGGMAAEHPCRLAARQIPEHDVAG